MNETVPFITPIALALGSNLGDRLANLQAAVTELASYMTITDLSSVYETAPVYVTDQPAFLNAAITGTTHLAPLTFLWSIKQLEMELGRQPTFHYGPRVIDIDLLLFGEAEIHEAELTVPHARMTERAFVLQPLKEIAGGWIHPVAQRSIEDLAQAIDGGDVRPFNGRLFRENLAL